MFLACEDICNENSNKQVCFDLVDTDNNYCMAFEHNIFTTALLSQTVFEWYLLKGSIKRDPD